MAKYAESTGVSSEQSRTEIERTLRRYGADGFMYGWQGTMAIVGFTMNGRQIKFLLPMPDPKASEFRYTPARRIERSATEQQKAYDQACRQRWRALALVIKAKLEAVEAGITVFEKEFLAHIVLPDGQTAGDYMLPQIETAYTTGQMPALLPQITGGGRFDE